MLKPSHSQQVYAITTQIEVLETLLYRVSRRWADVLSPLLVADFVFFLKSQQPDNSRVFPLFVNYQGEQKKLMFEANTKDVQQLKVSFNAFPELIETIRAEYELLS